jgi:FKBP-type peptidyl-prolyl cis-trans isomerase FkpA
MRWNKVLVFALLVGLVLPACTTEPAVSQELDTDDKKAIYAMGLMVASQMGQLGLSAEELEILKAGLTDGVNGTEPKVVLEDYIPKIQELAQARFTAAAEKEQTEADAFLAAEAAKDGVTKLDSGVLVSTLQEGTGANPTAADTVKVHYKGTLRNGDVFDSSIDRGEPAEFPLGQVIPCWTEGMQQIKVGGKARLVCPPDKAYGSRGAPPKIPANAALIFEVELLEIVAPAAPAAPAAPPGGATQQ